MSSIEKLSIRGIRSFSPDRDQVIEFYSPLTMIVGHNGCGKTTIIECLKYMLTGTLPPGTKSGQYFVNDPKVSGAQEVKASIKLRLKGHSGKTMVSIRYFQLTQSRSRLTFKALDGVIRTFGSDGETKSMSHRCSDMDKQMPLLVGVSKAILENVIFCHQEESNWPLMEGKFLKEKFDDIFEATRYSKAMENIRKAKKSYHDISKRLKGEFMQLEERKETAAQIQRDVRKAEKEMVRNQAAIDDADQQIRDMEAEISELVKKLESTRKQEALFQGKKQEVQDAEREVNIRRRSVKLIPNKTRAEIQQMLDSFGDEADVGKEQLEKSEEALEAKQAELSKLTKRKEQLISEKGSITANLHNLRRALKSRDSLVADFGRKYRIPVSEAGQAQATDSAEMETKVEDDESFTAMPRPGVQRFLERLEGKLSETKTGVDAVVADTRKEEEAAFNAASQLRRNMENVTQELDGCSKAVAAKTAEQEAAIKRLQQLRSSHSGSGLGFGDSILSQPFSVGLGGGSLLERLDRARSDHKQLKEQEQNNSFQKQLKELRNRLDQAASDEQDLIATRTSMESYQEEFQVLATEERMLNSLGEETRDQLELISTRMMPFSGESMDLSGCSRQDWNAIRSSVESASASLMQKVEAAEAEERLSRKKVDDVRSEITQIEALQNRDMDNLDGLRAQNTAFSRTAEVVKTQLNSAIEKNILKPGADAETVEAGEAALQQLRKKYDRKRGKVQQFHSVMQIAKRMLQSVEQNCTEVAPRGECPSCQRMFSSDTERTRFMQIQQDKIENITRQKEEEERNLELVKQIISAIEAEMPTYRRWLQTREQEAQLVQSIEAAKKKTGKLREEIEALSGEVDRKASAVAGVREVAEELKKQKDRVSELCTRAERLKQGKQRASMLSRSDTGASGPSTLKEVQEALEQLRQKKDGIIQEERKLSEENNQLQQRINREADTIRELERNVEEDRKRQRELDSLNETKEAAIKEIRALETKSRELRKQHQALQDQVLAADSALEQCRQSSEGKRKEKQDQFEQIRRDMSQMELVISSADTLLEEGLEDRKKDVDAELQHLDDHGDSLLSEMQALEEEVLSLRNGVRQKDEIRNNIQQNLELKEHEEQLVAAQAELAEAERAYEEGAGAALEDLHVQQDRIKAHMQRVMEERAEMRGVHKSLSSQINALQDRLGSKTYANIDAEYNEKNIELQTTEMVEQDLDSYYKAVDRALMSYHSMKIAEINKIIRELWQLTYSGQDIESIEIVGEEGGQTSTARARSYNYKVVMRKGDALLEMRGRCSAGQRVLACIVIRLALAETFCLTCGILALDEPTTNLDYENKAGLAHALAMIIGARSEQHNFQLLCITHDEDFVGMMNEQLQAQNGLSMPEYYWKISREELSPSRFFSRIERIDWSELQG